MLGVALVAASLGAPQFVSDSPLRSQEAAHVWAAATECAGWDAPAHARVYLTRSSVQGAYTGGAFVDRHGLYRISLGSDSFAPHGRTLVHELSHAWARSGPPALLEGRTDLLGDCVAARLPWIAPLDPDPGTPLDAMPDLRTWTNPPVGPLVDEQERLDAYLGAARLLRVVATVLPARALWPEDGHLGWDDLEALLEAEGPAGATILAVLEAGVERQRAALSDVDRDGVPFLAEILQGTDPRRWDSDGDGWWDGSTPTVAAIPLPPDGTPVCSGYTAGPSGGTVQVVIQGRQRGVPAPWVRAHAGSTLILEDPSYGVPVPSGQPILLSLEGPLTRSTGGTHALVGGQGLTEDWNCRSTPAYTVWVEDPRATPLLDPFARSLEEHLHRARGLAGTPKRRAVVVLGTPSPGVVDGVVHISQGQVAWALEAERPDALAAIAVATHHVWQGEHPSWDAAEALARDLMDTPPDLMFLTVDEDAAEAWSVQARECAEGWPSVLRGECAP